MRRGTREILWVEVLVGENIMGINGGDLIVGTKS